MKNLLGRLMSRPFEELKVIASAWGALTRDPNPSHNDLAIGVYHAMVDPSAARSVWEALDPDMRGFVSWLLDQRNMLALADDLPAILGRPPEEVVPLLERVRLAGICDVDEALVRGTRVVSSGDNLYAWGARNQPEAQRRRVVSISTEAGKVLRALIEESGRPAPFEDSFTTLLGNLEQEQVQRIASTWKLPEANRYYKSELIGVMTEFIATKHGRESLLGPMPVASRSMFEYVEEHGGRARASEVRQHFDWDEKEFRTAALPLLQRALLWDVLEGNTRYLFIAADVAGRKASAPPSPVVLPKLDAPAPYSIESRLPYELPWDLLTLLAQAASGDIPLTLQDTRITKRVAKRLNDSFLQPADLKGGTDYIDIVVHMGLALGVLSEKDKDGDQPALGLGPRVSEWARLAFPAQRRRLLGLWLEDRKWAEPATYGTIYWWNSDLTGGRKRLVNHLLELPVGQWISLDAFLRKIHLVDPFLIWDQDELMRRFGLRALQGFRNQWFSIEARIIADMIKTMLLWLGVVEIGRDKPKRFVAFRVTEEGRALLDPDYDADTPRASKTLLVQPNYEVLVLQPESRVLWDLLRSADLVHHDRVSVYVINKESIGRAVEAGLTAAQIKDILNANTGKALPQNVLHSIDDWARLVRRANIVRTTLIEVEDASVLDEMMASRKTKRYVERRISPTIAVAALPEVSGSARDDPWQKLMKELKAAGYSARFVGANGEQPAEVPQEAGATPTSLPVPGSASGATTRRSPDVSRITTPAKNGILPTGTEPGSQVGS